MLLTITLKLINVKRLGCGIYSSNLNTALHYQTAPNKHYSTTKPQKQSIMFSLYVYFQYACEVNQCWEIVICETKLFD